MNNVLAVLMVLAGLAVLYRFVWPVLKQAWTAFFKPVDPILSYDQLEVIYDHTMNELEKLRKPADEQGIFAVVGETPKKKKVTKKKPSKKNTIPAKATKAPRKKSSRKP